MKNSFRTGVARIGLGALALTLTVVGCAPGGSQEDVERPRSKPAAEIETDPAKAGDITLTVWDQHVDGASNEAILELNQRFEQRYPNITIKRVARSFDDLKTTLKLALSGDNPPDVVQANQGYPDMGAFVKGGLLTPMDSYAEVYDWKKRYPKQLLAMNSFTEDGETWQQGKLWGVSQLGEIVGVYYNRDLLAKAGVEQPKTFAEFEASLPKLKKAGVLPIQFGTSNKSPSIHLLGVLLAATVGKERADNLVTGAEPAQWNDPEVVGAIQKVAEWSKKGYLPAGANGQSGDQATAAFGKGEGAYFVNGTWELANVDSALGKKAGFMLPPPAENGQSATLGGQGLAWSLTSKGKHADAAAAYVDFITSDAAMEVAGEKGDLPIVEPKKYRPEKGSLSADMFDAWATVSQENALVPYLDYATPTFYDTLTANLQQVIGDKTEPESAADAMEEDFSAFQEGK